MNIPGFTAEASLNKRARYYVSLRGTPVINDAPPAGPVSFAAFGLPPNLEDLFYDFSPEAVCDACMRSCVGQGLGYALCRYYFCKWDCILA
jgi:hypothetical protein